MQYSTHKKPIIYWLYTGMFFIFLMVLIGGITRLTHSGLSIVTWGPFKDASLFPSDEEWNVLFDNYKQSPEFSAFNAHFTLEDFKSIFWWENIHRYIGRMIGLIFIFPYLFFTIKKWIKPALHQRLLIIFLLGALQGFLGWFMVKSGLIDNPAVSHYRLAAHLLTAFLTCAYMFWVLLEIKNDGTSSVIMPSSTSGIVKNLSILTFLCLIMQITYGAFVAGLKAGKMYNTFPKMGEHFIPKEIMNNATVLTFLETMPGVQFVHRYIAYLVVILCFYIAWKAQNTSNPELKKAVHFVLILCGVQFLLGVFTLLYSVPICLGILHQLGAFILLLGSVNLLFRASYQQKAQ